MIGTRAPQRPDHAGRLRELWRDLTRWGRPHPWNPPRVGFGRRRIRLAIRPLADFAAEEPTATMEEARERLREFVAGWPGRAPRLAIEGDTGLGKTHEAVRCCVDHALGRLGIPGALLFVAHSVERVRAIVAKIREGVARAGGDSSLVRDLLGRQALDTDAGESWSTLRFGCINPFESRRFGRKGRQVKAEVCEPCPHSKECQVSGYLAHTKEAADGRVIVTTLARLPTIADELWERIGLVIGDEDLMPGLLQEFWVFASDLRRAERHIVRRRERREARRRKTGRALDRRTRALVETLPLLRHVLGAMKAFRGDESRALVSLLPEECTTYMTAEGAQALLQALPWREWRTPDGSRRMVRDELAPAPWERRRARWTPRQTWGRFLVALAADLVTGDTERSAVVRVVRTPRRRAPPRIHVLRFDERTIRKLRARPLLLLDATMHPAIGPVLDVSATVIRYRQGRKVVQVLTSLLDQGSLRERRGGEERLSRCGRLVVSHIAAWFGGRAGYVLCRKSVRPLVAEEASRYHELRRAEFVTPKNERGWDAAEETAVMVVLGRYAKNGSACLREAHALRSVYRQLTGTTDALDRLERPPGPQTFLGRGKPLLYRGEPVERLTREPEDRLAALLQDADRVATVRQFVGRERAGKAYVLLYRGDPTVPADALVEDRDLAEALPVCRPEAATGRAAPPSEARA